MVRHAAPRPTATAQPMAVWLLLGALLPSSTPHVLQELEQLYEDEKRSNDQLIEEKDQLIQEKDAAMAK